MASSPVNWNITSLLQGVNSGLARLRHGPPVLDRSSSDEDESVHDEIEANTDKVGNDIGTKDVTIADGGQANIQTPVINHGDEETAGGNKKPAAKPAKHTKKRAEKKAESRPKNNHKKKIDNNDDDPDIDPPRKTMPNLLEMEEAFDQGYDSDGWSGPARGTDPKEVAATAEESLTETNDTEQTVTATNEATNEAATEEVSVPKHVPIDDNALQTLTIPMLK